MTCEGVMGASGLELRCVGIGRRLVAMVLWAASRRRERCRHPRCKSGLCRLEEKPRKAVVDGKEG